ncbi:hypothetical protein [Brevundimonas diminuta]|uniref:hypothetical protein n=1 Tax=Brevundimonas diminuta TaxID=293 RepID=UPI00320813BC
MRKTRLLALLTLGGCVTNAPAERQTEILTLGDTEAAVTVYLPTIPGRRPVTITSAPYCAGAMLRPEASRLIEVALKSGSAVVVLPLPCGASSLSFSDFEKGMAKVRAEADRLNLNLDAMTIIGEDDEGS